MAIKIPNWIKRPVTYFYSAVGVIAAAALVVIMPDAPEQYLVQVYIGQDTTITIVGGDTTKTVTDENTLTHLKNRAQEQYDNGYRLHIFKHITVNTLTGEMTPEKLLTIAPPVGMQVVWTVRAGAGEIATEKIPEKLEALGDSLANEIGWYCVMDTAEVDSEKTTITQPRWTEDSTAKPVRIEYVAPSESELIEVIR